METQDFNKELMDYLYGEMTAEEKKNFEVKLANDSELQKEFKELSEVRSELDKLSDKEVMEPFSALGKPRGGRWSNPLAKRRLIVFKPVTAVAAALLLLMLFGYVTDFSISINDQGFYLGFGKADAEIQENYMTQEQVADLLNQEIRKSNEALLARLSSAEASNEERFASLEQSSNQQKGQVITPEYLENYFARVDKKNTDLMKDILTRTTAQQQEYYKSMFTQFSKFYLEQRSSDMTMISNSILQLKEDQNLQKQETDQALAGLYTTVNQRDN